MAEERTHRIRAGGAVVACALLLSLITAFNQVKAQGLSWQEEHYQARLEAVVAGEAPSPFQYRILSDSLTVAVYRLFERVGMPRPVGVAFVSIRVTQNLLLFLLAIAYYRRLGLSIYLGILGISALAWGMMQGNLESDLAIDTYTDLILYLWAGLTIVTGRVLWIVPITVLGTLNRETSGLVPVLLVAAYLPPHAADSRRPALGPGRVLSIAAVSLAAYGLIFAGLRLYFGPREWVVHPTGAAPGLGMLWHNLSDAGTWVNLVGTLGLIPLLAVVSWRAWRWPLGAFFWAMVPAWLLIHLCFGPLAETRLVLVPLAMAFIPGALCGLMYFRGSENRALEAA